MSKQAMAGRRRKHRSDSPYLDQWFRRERAFKTAVFAFLICVMVSGLFYAMSAASHMGPR